jgi:hypothetical protein
MDSFQDALDEYNANFERLNGILGDKSLLDSAVVKTQRIEETKEILVASLPVAVQAVIELAATASTESVRFRAAQYLINISLGKDPAIKAEDPALELIERLSSDPTDE